MDKITDGLKTVFLAGVGAAALTVEKSQELIKDLAARGERTVEQGKALNQELKHKVDETLGDETDRKNEVTLTKEEIEALKELLKKHEDGDGNA